MKSILNLRFSSALVLALATLGVKADTFFSDNFSNGSTLTNPTPANPTTNSTAYQLVSSKNWVPAPSITTSNLKFGIASTTSGSIEVQALFATNAVALTQPGDYVQMTVTFTNISGLLTAAGQLGFGLYNSGQVKPIAGGLNSTAVNTISTAATGGAQNWIGYVGQVNFNGAASRIMTRAAQTAGSDNRNQDLLTSGSGSSSYGNPGAATVGSTTTSTVTLVAGGTYTEVFTITLNDVSSLTITNALYSGPDTSGAVLASFGAVATNTTYLTSGFDGFAIGWRSGAATPSNNIAIASIQIAGQSTVVSAPPTITSQPVPVTVATNGACAFAVAANGFNVVYQWYRNSIILTNGGNISGATSAQLVVSPAGTTDAFSSANGYYVKVSGAGGYSTNSVTNSLALRPATNLTWTAAGGNIWDLNSTVSWQDNSANPAVFNYGDPVTFDDSASLKIINLSGTYLSAASVTVDTAINYTFQGAGSIAGPGSMLVKGSGQLTLNNANSFSGGTTISNATAYVLLQNYNGLGTGPVTLAQAGGQMEIVPTGSATLGINGDINVADDFSIQVNGVGTFATVFLGNLNGAAGKTLTFNPKDLSTTNRFRVYGTNTLCNANIVLNGPATSQALFNGTVLAPYAASGSQTYNGIISGNGGLVQRGTASTTLRGQNTYAGGTFATAGGIAFGVDSVPTTGAVVSSPIGTGPLFVSPEVGSANGSGTVLAANGARIIANPIQYPTATNNQTLIMGGTNALTFTGAYALNGQDGSATAVNRTIQVNNTNSLTTLSGVISDGGMGCGLIKTGTGVLALNNTETYTGPTTISGGTLAVNGSLSAASSVTATNGLLGGSGTVNGTVTIQNAGGVAPGNSIGTMTINNNLTIQGGSINFFEVNKGAGTKDLVIVTGNATYNGTLSVTNLSGTITTADSFQIFNVTGTKTGTFTNIIGSPGAGMAWSFTNSTGILGVIATVATNPTNLTAVVNGGKLELSWPADHTGWHLQAQTNSLAVGLLTNAASWVTITNTDLSNKYTNTINTANGTVFYRMAYP